MNVVAQMLVRNEADIIAETVREVFRWVDVLIVLDGGSTDLTTQILETLAEEYAAVGKTLALTSRPDPGGLFADHYRNELLALTAPFEPDWVISVDADEIYDTSPVKAIMMADAAGANAVRCWVPEFWLTFDDLRKGALHEDEAISVQKRRRWYSWGHTGVFIWKWNPRHYYPNGIPKRTPELPNLNWREWLRLGPMQPICKHYPVRSLRQGLKRMDERLERGGRKYFGKYALNWIVDEVEAQLHFRHNDVTWDTRYNHDKLREWMGRQ